MAKRRPATENPLPVSLDAALDEIFRLQRQLNVQNEKRATEFVRYARELQCMRGEIAALKGKLKRLIDYHPQSP